MKKLTFGLALLAIALPAFSHLAQFTKQNGGSTLGRDRWPLGAIITWNLNPTLTGTKVSVGTATPAQVIANSFAPWASAPTASLPVARGADTSKTSPAFDCVNVIAFKCSSGCDFSTDDSTLAITFTTTSDSTSDQDCAGNTPFLGQILDADILFNQNVDFTTGGGTGQNLQTVATHEIGHFFGLDHSPVVRAMMYPFAPESLTTLSYDDVAGISALYPISGTVSEDTCTGPLGVISGTVNFAGSGGVFGAHVFADSTTNALYGPYGVNIRKSPIGTLTRPDGTYCITGLPPDSYIVTAEPLDLPASNDDVSGYAGNFNRSAVQTNFITRWH